jgi:hypothetical protein
MDDVERSLLALVSAVRPIVYGERPPDEGPRDDLHRAYVQARLVLSRPPPGGLTQVVEHMQPPKRMCECVDPDRHMYVSRHDMRWVLCADCEGRVERVDLHGTTP